MDTPKNAVLTRSTRFNEYDSAWRTSFLSSGGLVVLTIMLKMEPALSLTSTVYVGSACSGATSAKLVNKTPSSVPDLRFGNSVSA